MSALHCSAFDLERGWSAAEFAALRDSPHVTAHIAPHGFALTRTVAGESELLTLAVARAHRRKGIAAGLLEGWLAGLAHRAEIAFLEVAADNHGARALYARFGFEEIARRTGYYARSPGPAVDALILRRDLTLGQPGDSGLSTSESG